jgi:hypothetical protein
MKKTSYKLNVYVSHTTVQKWRTEAIASNITCLVTLHGIGFQQPPVASVANSGYADPLHEHLSKCLKSRLCDDPF